MPETAAGRALPPKAHRLHVEWGHLSEFAATRCEDAGGFLYADEPEPCRYLIGLVSLDDPAEARALGRAEARDPDVIAAALPRVINFRFLPPRIVGDPIWREIATELVAAIDNLETP